MFWSSMLLNKVFIYISVVSNVRANEIIRLGEGGIILRKYSKNVDLCTPWAENNRWKNVWTFQKIPYI